MTPAEVMAALGARAPFAVVAGALGACEWGARLTVCDSGLGVRVFVLASSWKLPSTLGRELRALGWRREGSAAWVWTEWN